MLIKISDTAGLKALEVLEELSRTGSMQETAGRLGMSTPAASQQLKQLETALGRKLVVHGRRPMTLTRHGEAYLLHVRAALQHLRQGAAELLLDDLGAITALRIGIIDDFDSEVSPRLAVALADTYSPSELTLTTATSTRIVQDIASNDLDTGIAANPMELPADVMEIPLLNDPFVLAVPRGYLSAAPADLNELISLPYLRYERSLALGRQIATHLARLRLELPSTMSLDSNQAIFALIANGNGWALTTMVGYLRAQRFHDDVDIFPLPFTPFSRTISLLYHRHWTAVVANDIAETLRGILQSAIVDKARQRHSWLSKSFKVIRMPD
ncbi:LysR family transcriptional regulator [Granulosicoccus sp. 3-233]|uniref:LysR family transcriptional regulator n=1 Tax=Granulosicoccus sp. 3-233 TaxID=3417969 RepID=UPI003D353EFD